MFQDATIVDVRAVYMDRSVGNIVYKPEMLLFIRWLVDWIIYPSVLQTKKRKVAT